MISYRSQVTVDRPPDAVFAYLVEPEKQALWADLPMRRLTAGPLATGSRIDVTFGKGPLKVTLGLEFTDLQPPRRMAWRTFAGPILWDGEYRVEPTSDGRTELSQEGRMRFTGFWRLLEPFVAGEIRTGEVKELEKLKAAAESA